ncbi:Glycine receptor subunit alphaZ1 [Hypsibius exemplaris]|uniref:Glycine receptor subunit alphaZ1 n=1 Tax=Hypsibius exemplaris TaxID=2072580 RepID=A0A1W0X0I4_HYPEX|nr:Glycine receptor subunit alphaZ1 [Hypsibius exemplaris]
MRFRGMEPRFCGGLYLALLHILLLPVRCREFPHYLFQSLMKGYNKEEWPSYQEGPGRPTRVYVEIYIVSISSINAESMDFVVDFLLTQHWKDPRLRFSENVSKVLELHQLRQIKKLWLPDPYIINAKSAYFHEITLPNRFARVTTEGNITYNARLTAKLSCQMQLRLYPMDTQECEIYLESYGYSTEILYLHWHWDKDTAFSMEPNLELPNFMRPISDSIECVDTYSMGLFSCLKVKLKLQRRISYHLTQTYLPTVLIVSVSWVTFWLSVEAVPARVTLGITTLLTMTTLIGGAKQGLPAVSYIKALDVWMGTCTFFVFSTLLEYVVVSKASRRKVVMLVPMPNNNNANTNHAMPRSSTFSSGAKFENHYSPPGTAKSPNQTQFRPHKLSIPPQNGSFEYDVESPVDTYLPGPTKVILTPAQQAKRIDVIARVLFPSLFGAFNFVYWTYYLMQSWDEAG